VKCSATVNLRICQFLVAGKKVPGVVFHGIHAFATIYEIIFET